MSYRASADHQNEQTIVYSALDGFAFAFGDGLQRDVSSRQHSEAGELTHRLTRRGCGLPL